MRTALYKHFNGDELLYVGVSLNHIARLAQHSDASHWANEITSVTVEYFGTREEALIQETKSIHSEKPLHNIQKQPRPDPDKSSIMQMLSNERTCLTYRTTTVKPMNRLDDLRDYGLSKAKAESLIDEGVLGALKVPSAAKRGFTYYVSGWQLLTFFEYAHEEGRLYK